MITIKHSGNFMSVEGLFKRVSRSNRNLSILKKYGREGVNALSNATPQDTGLTSQMWEYEAKKSPGGYSLEWSNTNMVDGIPIVILLQYGHGTGSGGYVQGRDFINPAIKPIFDKIADDLWKEITNG